MSNWAENQVLLHKQRQAREREALELERWKQRGRSPSDLWVNPRLLCDLDGRPIWRQIWEMVWKIGGIFAILGFAFTGKNGHNDPFVAAFALAFVGGFIGLLIGVFSLNEREKMD